MPEYCYQGDRRRPIRWDVQVQSICVILDTLHRPTIDCESMTGADVNQVTLGSAIQRAIALAVEDFAA